MVNEDKGSDKENVAPETGPQKRNHWTTADKAALVDFLIEELEAGRDADNNFKPVVWTNAAIKLNEMIAGGSRKTSDTCKSQFASLSKSLRIVKELREKSGVGWDDAVKCVTAPDGVWDDLIKANKKYKPFRKQPFPLYDELERLTGDKSANGKGALSISALFNNNPLDGELPASQRTELEAEEDVEETQGVGDSSWDTNEFDEDTEPSQASAAPAPTSRGRKRAASDELNNEPRSMKKRSARPTAPAAVADMADAIRELGMSFGKTQNDQLPSTPKRLTEAIKRAQQDSCLNIDERTKLMGLFTDKMAVADAYLAFDDKEIRTAFVRRSISGL